MHSDIKWQPIETCPHDDSYILLSNGFWAMEHQAKKDGTFLACRFNNITADSNCKYWQPLPKSRWQEHGHNNWVDTWKARSNAD